MLQIVALPIGNKEDITLRALKALKDADIIIGEERRELFALLKGYEIDPHKKRIEFLNEHSTPEEIQELGALCKTLSIALVSDCGTPVFCDPGSHLIRYCRENSIEVTTLPGASSLMALLSLSSQKLTQFYFYGFLPREKNERSRELARILKTKEALILMDTPYRLSATLEQLAAVAPGRKALIATDITLPSELVLEGSLKFLFQSLKGQKKEFLILLYEL